MRINTDDMKAYMKEYNNQYKRTVDGLISIMYSSLKGNSKKRNMDMPNFTKKELTKFLSSSNEFSSLFAQWISSDCLKNLDHQ